MHSRGLSTCPGHSALNLSSICCVLIDLLNPVVCLGLKLQHRVKLRKFKLFALLVPLLNKVTMSRNASLSTSKANSYHHSRSIQGSRPRIIKSLFELVAPNMDAASSLSLLLSTLSTSSILGRDMSSTKPIIKVPVTTLSKASPSAAATM